MFYHDLPRISKFFLLLLNKINPYKFAKKIGVRINPTVHLYGNIHWGSEPWIIELGSNIYLTDDVSFITHDGGYYLFRDEIPDIEITKPIVVKNNVFIGVGSVILPGVTIGNNVVIGAFGCYERRP